MPCEFCGQYIDHNPRCPLYERKESSIKCSICGNEICEGEEYIENEDCKQSHLDCIDTTREMLKFLGQEVKIM
jgi:hypothetical protein